jgi:hypothetical protein
MPPCNKDHFVHWFDESGATTAKKVCEMVRGNTNEARSENFSRLLILSNDQKYMSLMKSSQLEHVLREYPKLETGKILDNKFMLMAYQISPEKYIGYYTPSSSLNKEQVVGIAINSKQEKRIVYKEDRRLFVNTFSARTAFEAVVLNFNTIIKGLLNPLSMAQAFENAANKSKFKIASDERVVEGMRQETYVIFAKSIVDIKKAVEKINNALKFRDEAIANTCSQTQYISKHNLARKVKGLEPKNVRQFIRKDWLERGRFVNNSCVPDFIPFESF